MHIDDFLARFDKPRQHGKQWMVKCPAHPDDKASLSISVNDKGDILLKCFANCETKEIVAAMGLRESDLFNSNGKDKPRTDKSHTVVSTVDRYDYTDTSGNVVYQVVRKSNKTFPQRRKTSDGQWVWGLGDTAPLPYHLPALIEAVKAKKPIYIPEGEKDVHTLESLGLVATCNSGGAGNWTDTHAQWLKGANVVILPDNDIAGQKHGRIVAESLLDVASAVKVVHLPGLPLKGDVSDWVQDGHTKAELIDIVKHAPTLKSLEELLEREPEPESEEDPNAPRIISYSELLTGELKPVNWIVENLVPQDGITIIGGDSGVGKSWVVHHMAMTISAGLPFLGQFDTKQSRVLIFDAESGESLIRRRVLKLFTGLLADNSLSAELPVDVATSAFRLDNEAHEQWHINTIKEREIGLVIADPLIHSLPAGTNENDSTAMAAFFEKVRKVQAATGVCFIFVHHSRKQSATSSNSAGQMLRGSSAIRGILDSHLFLRALEPGKLLCEHDKSRHAEAEQPFIISITDTDPETIQVKYAGEANESTGDLVAVASAFIERAIGSAGGEMSRQQIIDAGKTEKLKQRTIDAALSAGIDKGLWSKKKAGHSSVYYIDNEDYCND